MTPGWSRLALPFARLSSLRRIDALVAQAVALPLRYSFDSTVANGFESQIQKAVVFGTAPGMQRIRTLPYCWKTKKHPREKGLP